MDINMFISMISLHHPQPHGKVLMFILYVKQLKLREVKVTYSEEGARVNLRFFEL